MRSAYVNVRYYEYRPVKAGSPISASAVLFNVKVSPKTADCGYTVPFAANRDVESIGKARD
jgi:hypothetical protein